MNAIGKVFGRRVCDDSTGLHVAMTLCHAAGPALLGVAL